MKIVLTVEAMAASATRSTSAQWSRNSTAVGMLSVAASAASSLERRRLLQLAADDAGRRRRRSRSARTGSASPSSAAGPRACAPIGRKTAVAMIWPAWVPLSVKLVKKPAPVRRARARGSSSSRRPARRRPRSPAAAAGTTSRTGAPDADLVVGGQAADEERRGAHQREREDQDALAAELVADVAEEERADRPGDVADAEGGERQQRGGRGVGLGEEDLAEDQRGGGAVDEEVVVLQGAADPARQRRLARGLARLERGRCAPASCSRRRLLPADVMYGLVRYVRRRRLVNGELLSCAGTRRPCRRASAGSGRAARGRPGRGRRSRRTCGGWRPGRRRTS